MPVGRSLHSWSRHALTPAWLAVCLAVVAVVIALYSQLSTNTAINEQIDRTARTDCRLALIENFETTISDYIFYLGEDAFALSTDAASETLVESDVVPDLTTERDRDWLVSGAALSMANLNVKTLCAEFIPQSPPSMLGPANDRTQARQYREEYFVWWETVQEFLKPDE